MPLLPQIRSGALKALAVTSSQRVAQLPDTPTLAASGLAPVNASLLFAVLFVAVFYGLGLFLFKRQWFIKV